MAQSNGHINNLHYLKTYRKNLRSNMTPAEATLWLALKNKQLEGRRFRRQFSVGNYILDFYCPSEKIAIELDGHHHFTDAGFQKDLIRDDYLEAQGIRVLRFENETVFQNLEGILEVVKRNFKTPLDSPLQGESRFGPEEKSTSPLQGEKKRGKKWI